MSDTVTVLLAAFGGGLAGAVLQPLVVHGLGRIRRSEEIRKSRERNLRRMLGHAIAAGREYAGLLYFIEFRFKQGVPLTAAEISTSCTEAEGRLPWKDVLWQPERIKDVPLQQLAREHQDTLGNLKMMIVWALKYDRKQALEWAEHLEEFQTKITARMDELNWPEVDD